MPDDSKHRQSTPPPFVQPKSGQRRPAALWMWALGAVIAAVLIFVGIDEAAKFKAVESGRTQFVYSLSNMFYYIGGITGVYVGWVVLSLFAAVVMCGIAGRRGLKRWNR